MVTHLIHRDNRHCQVLVPAGTPTAGIRAVPAETYWPSVCLSREWLGSVSPPDVWRPPLVYSYALALVSLERAIAAADYAVCLARGRFQGRVGSEREQLRVNRRVLVAPETPVSLPVGMKRLKAYEGVCGSAGQSESDSI